jgi:hypothetical protein
MLKVPQLLVEENLLCLLSAHCSHNQSLGRVYSIAIFNPWLKPLIKNVSNIAVKLLNEMLRLGADQKSMRAPVGYWQGWRP